MVLKAFDKAEIDKIYKKKLFYSIIKYNDEFDRLSIENEERANLLADVMGDKINYAYQLNNSTIDYRDFDNIVEYLDKETEKFNSVVKENETDMDICSDAIIENLIGFASLQKNDIDKCRFLFEYVCRNVRPNEKALKYNDRIPYGNDYPFEFTRDGIPLANKGYEGILIGKVGEVADIANFLVFMGKKLGLDIQYCSCIRGKSKTDEKAIPYAINTVTIDGDMSYMDAYSVITGNKDIEEAFLVDRPTLMENSDINEIERVGMIQNVNYTVDLHLDELKEAESRILPQVEYIDNDIFKEVEKQK